MMFHETIVAPATAFGRSSIGVIRVSGSSVIKIIKKFLKISMTERFAHYVSFFDINGNILDKGIALFFHAPRSFTGEDVLEFHGHGNPFLLDILIKNILSFNNVRMARPGEFSERAFLNKKIDLVQSEAVCDLINAQSELAIKAASCSLSGYFSKKILYIIEQLKLLYSRIEAVVNFPDEINELDLFKNIKINLIAVIKLIQNLIDISYQGNILKKGIKIVISGAPNVGKSSLFNYLSNEQSSIVTNIPGTTRDIICKDIWINGISCELMDTAGLHKSKDIIEQIGIKLAKKKLHTCDHIFLVLDVTNNHLFNDKLINKNINQLKLNQNITFIFNKIDLVNQRPCLKFIDKKFKCIYLSIKYKIGLDFLKNRINEISSSLNNVEGVFLARRRHLSELEKALKYLINGKKYWLKNKYIELLSDNIRLSIDCLLKITGNFSNNDLLNKIFSEFCIGK
ncbi:tRNA modification GTPase MnmE [Buchnera aphidicola (Cinara piceae)]|uniref:tRNA modification GTPase MnmE n=1 Tax=Buchnera aphidicola (Cinara piceae) TaxID=1660043 RepID=A0A803FT64_9GAMM|nr:tRNA uridine-5-carboxymethylaminomethyl(34) synthesis GTPase MnmE [Buchnera aphidicola]VFP87764.1 tRNA modification GTPase MnmE [Buchnera aphidicola (Cinara piceae)]